MGNLHPPRELTKAKEGFRVIENLAMSIPVEFNEGNYKLQADYINRRSGKISPISLTPVEITLDNQATVKSAPEPDLVAKLYGLGEYLSQGKLDPIFEQIAPFNQYDPIQDYLVQAEQALTQRLKTEPKT
ncbi:MAG: hypothetical protein HC908_00140 [Calothrix sp. SM1_7_51]|nr:hypothetical protein [Calothrix sp. SM1_7_51]